MARRRYLFTNKKNPPRGVFSVGIGLIGLFSVLMSLYMSYKSGGEFVARLGAVVLLAVVFALLGLVMGILSHMETDMFTFFPKLGIGINLLVIAAAGFIMYMGA